MKGESANAAIGFAKGQDGYASFANFISSLSASHGYQLQNLMAKFPPIDSFF